MKVLAYTFINISLLGDVREGITMHKDTKFFSLLPLHWMKPIWRRTVSSNHSSFVFCLCRWRLPYHYRAYFFKKIAIINARIKGVYTLVTAGVGRNALCRFSLLVLSFLSLSLLVVFECWLIKSIWRHGMNRIALTKITAILLFAPAIKDVIRTQIPSKYKHVDRPHVRSQAERLFEPFIFNVR